MNKVYIGFDKKEEVAYDVCKFSIERNLTKKIEINSLIQNELREKNIYYRPIDNLSTTDFSLTRFLVPYLSEYKGFSIFVDLDFLFTKDINILFDSVDKTKAVSVVKHDYKPTNKTKGSNLPQHIYPRKNWSSLIVFNNEHPSNKKLNLDIVNNETPQFLHRFSWLDDSEIGEVSHEWNYLVGWYSDVKKPKGIHYTEGGPWFDNYKDCDFSKEWLYEYFLMKEKK